jgi:hypothetical protein
MAAAKTLTIQPDQKVSPHKGKGKALLWFAPADLAIFLMLLGPIAANIGAVSPAFGLSLFVSSAVIGVIAIFCGFFPLRKISTVFATASILLGLLPVGILGYLLVRSHSYPLVNDVSTDLDNPPVFKAAAKAPENKDKDLSFPSEFRNIVRESYPALISLQVQKPAVEVFANVKATAYADPTFSLQRVDEEALILEGEAVTGLFHFVDDFVIRVQQLEKGSQIDMRSRSRVGKGDFGANAKRIAAFFAKLKGSAAEEKAFLNEMPEEGVTTTSDNH